MKYAYAAVRCKTCLDRGTNIWLLLKYLGLDDGKTVHTLVFPAPPALVAFSMPCESCGFTNSYSRVDIEAVSTDQAPPSDLVEQF